MRVELKFTSIVYQACLGKEIHGKSYVKMDSGLVDRIIAVSNNFHLCEHCV